MLRQVGLAITVVTLRNERIADLLLLGMRLAGAAGGLAGSCPVGKTDLWLWRIRLVVAADYIVEEHDRGQVAPMDGYDEAISNKIRKLKELRIVGSEVEARAVEIEETLRGRS